MKITLVFNKVIIRPWLGIIFLLGLVVFGGIYPLHASILDTSTEIFKNHNPDGQKYQYVSAYLTALEYLHQNKKQAASMPAFSFDDIGNKGKVKSYIDQLNNENMNLRISRNLVKKFITPENGLILRSATLFVESCDELVDLNQQEKILFQEYFNLKSASDITPAQKRKFLTRHSALAEQRKEVSLKILEGSMLINRVLISDKEDKYGQLVMLGITQEQRKRLLEKINQFKGGEFDGEIRDGQSALEASVASIRSILADKSWATIK